MWVVGVITLAQPVLPLEASDNRDTAIVALKFVNSIAQGSRLDGKMPDPFAHPPLGRQTYSFGKFEDHAIDSFEQFASEITFKHRLSIGVDYVLETDIVGNTFFHIFGTERVTAGNKEKDAKGVIIGSHLDSTPNGGMYDGVLGVGAGLEAVDMLLRKGKPKKTITVVSWRSEESSPNNGVGCLGSQIATGALTIDQVEKIIYGKNSKGENVTFLQHLADKNGFSLAVMREKMVQILEKGAEHLLEKYDLGLELHIEQSGVIEANNRDLGIVAGGIGGARREKWNKDLSGLQEEYNTSDGYDFYHIKISGKRGHTGGTPPNPAKIKSDNAGDRWYREDALVGLSAILGRLDDSVIIREIGFGSPLGFTSIPDDVFIDIALPRGTILQGEELMKILGEKGVKGELNRSTGIPSGETFNGQPLGPIRGDVTIPFRISHVATGTFVEEVKKNPENPVGSSRVTVVDFSLKDGKLSWNLDYRHEGDKRTFDDLVAKVRSKIATTLTPTLVSHSLSMAVSDKVKGLLQEGAKTLGFSYVLMPSLPGHDVAYLGRIGIPVGMIFVRHDGISHHPGENVDPKHTIKPQQLLEKVVRDFAY